MPPRPAGHQRPRFSSWDPDTSANDTFQKPILPSLHGTPSSRRQYSYGAEVEPVPSRQGQALRRNQTKDINSAVKTALSRPASEINENGVHSIQMQRTAKLNANGRAAPLQLGHSKPSRTHKSESLFWNAKLNSSRPLISFCYSAFRAFSGYPG